MDSVEIALPLLRADLLATVGRYPSDVIDHAVAMGQLVERDDLGDKLVEDVQQAMHDARIDTSWPVCPHHRHHPLTYRDGAWWCPADGVRVAALGALGAVIGRPGSIKEGG